jgi:putative PIN family toxin of toxin-antitoxin system
MKVVLDTNILISALLVEPSPPAKLITLWRAGRFSLLTAAPQLDELLRVTRYPRIRERLTPALAGRLINELRHLAIVVDRLPLVEASPDSGDDYLLAIALGGSADYLVTGDKRDLLSLKEHRGTRIVSVRTFLGLRRL